MFEVSGRRIGSIEARRRIRGWFRTPDWRDSSTYPSASASGNRWAWEFLRRNEKFQPSYASFRRLIAHIPCKSRHLGHPQFAEHVKLLMPWGIDCWYPSTWIWGWPLDVETRELDQFEDEDLDSPCAFVSGPVDSSRYFDRPLGDTEYRVIFDAAMPIAPQIAQVKAILESKQSMLPNARTAVRPRWNLFPRYLRTFDGFCAMTAHGLSDTQALNALADQFMAEKMHLDDVDYVQDVRNALDAARKYIEYDYRVLPIMRGRPLSSQN